MDKTLYIVRGVPGTGKTTFATKMASKLKSAVVFANDDFFDNEGGPEWTASLLNDAKKLCYDNVEKSMRDSVNDIFVTNIFSSEKSYSRYVELANNYGYNYTIMVMDNKKESVHELTPEKMINISKSFTLNSTSRWKAPLWEIVHEKAIYDLMCCQPKSKFTLTEFIVNGVQVINYSYHMAEEKDFYKPIPDVGCNALNLRGMCYVDGVMFLSLPKFFNINQVSSTSIDLLMDKKITHIYDKHDGSLIMFVLINGEPVAKTINSFDNYQTSIASQMLKHNKELYDKVLALLTQPDYVTPVFELVSPGNKVVLEYAKTELIYLGYRQNTGDFKWVPNADMVDYVNDFDGLSDVIKSVNSLENKEGFIITFDDGTIVKLKTKWYIDRHFFNTEYKYRVNLILQSILDKTIDDISPLLKGDVYFSKVLSECQSVLDFVIDELIKIMAELDIKMREIDNCTNRVERAKMYKSFSDFEIKIIWLSKESNTREKICEYINRKVYVLKHAEKFMEIKTREDILSFLK